MIVIGVITDRDIHGLERTLKSLEQLIVPQNQEIEILVIDCDELKSAEQYIQNYSAHSKTNILYVNQPKKGAAMAKNEALHYAVKMFFDYVAFINAGDVADKLWLQRLYEVLTLYNADVATGPIMRDGKLDIKRKAGKRLFKNVRSNNVLISGQIYKRWMQRFDNKFSSLDGEDTDFYYRSWKKGGLHIWVDDAIVNGQLTESEQSYPQKAAKQVKLGAMYAMLYVMRNKGIVGHAILFPKIIEKLFIGVGYIVVGTTYALFKPEKAKPILYKGIYKFCWLKGAFKYLTKPQQSN